MQLYLVIWQVTACIYMENLYMTMLPESDRGVVHVHKKQFICFLLYYIYFGVVLELWQSLLPIHVFPVELTQQLEHSPEANFVISVHVRQIKNH